MTRLVTLIAATDLSAPSRHAAARAAMLARDTGAKLELLHVVETSALSELRHMLGARGDAVAQCLLDESHSALNKLAATVSEPCGINASTHLATGPLLQEIITQTDALDADLLVLGSRGTGFIRHQRLGATVERLLRKTLRPLLVVRQVPNAPYRRVLVAIDFSSWSVESIRFARALAPKAKIILFNAFEVPFEGKLLFAGVEDDLIQQYRTSAQQDALRDLHKTAANAGLKEGDYCGVIAHGDAASRILEQVEEQDADLIVVGKHGKGLTEELLLGSTTKHVLAGARCDVLVTQRGE